MKEKTGLPKRILSIDVPGGREGGCVLAVRKGPLVCVPIYFSPDKSLAEDFLILANLLDWATPHLVILEQPFLWTIASYIGGILMAAAERKIPWWQVGPSKAKKVVLGHGRASKEDVLKWAQSAWTGTGELTQHSADAFLYLSAWEKGER